MKELIIKRNTAWAICLISFIMIFASYAIMQTDWYPDQTLQGWPMVVSAVVCFCSLIVAFELTSKCSKVKKNALTISQNKHAQQSSSIQKNSPANSVASLVSAIIPLILLAITFFSSLSSNKSGANQAGMLFFIYYCTIGVPLALVWLICGILGLKSEKRTMAIVSLIIGPISFILMLTFMLTWH